ncbi:MAG: hypothetical protein IJI97_10565 [Clostridia bacterium]|nr:hypothetical protein [Clostridia bacterium]
MIEKTVLDWLGEQLTAPVYAEVPEGPPDAFVVVERTASGRTDRLRTATVAVQAYGASLYDAAALCEQVIAAMDGLASLPRVSACRLQSAYNWPDTRTKRRRYQAVFDIYYQEGD